MQTILTFISASLCILPILIRIIVGDLDFIDPFALKVYAGITVTIFVVLTIYNVITFINKKAPESIKYLSLLSLIALLGFLTDFNTGYNGFLGFLGFLSFMTYQK